jgi:hypothetical protein
VSYSVTVEPDPIGGAGHAVIRVHGAGPFTGPTSFRIRRDDYDDGVFGRNGWQVADELLVADSRQVAGNDLLLFIGPSIVQRIESAVYHFAIPAANIETTTFWPDLPLLAQGAANMVAEPARTGVRAAAVSRPVIQRPTAADTVQRPEPEIRSTVTRPAEPAPDDTVRLQPAIDEKPVVVPQPPAPTQRKWIPWASLALVLIVVAAAGGGYYYYYYLPHPPQQTANTDPITPTPPHEQPVVQPPAGPDLQNMSVAEALRSGASPEALLREGQRRLGLDAARHGDALLLMQGAADRGHGPAHAALGGLYDPNLPHPPDIIPDPRQAALHYRRAVDGGDTSVAAARAALKTFLERQVAQNDPFAPGTLNEFWQ